jgi:hypothetical protein
MKMIFENEFIGVFYSDIDSPMIKTLQIFETTKYLFINLKPEKFSLKTLTYLIENELSVQPT